MRDLGTAVEDICISLVLGQTGDMMLTRHAEADQSSSPQQRAGCVWHQSVGSNNAAPKAQYGCLQSRSIAAM